MAHQQVFSCQQDICCMFMWCLLLDSPESKPWDKDVGASGLESTVRQWENVPGKKEKSIEDSSKSVLTLWAMGGSPLGPSENIEHTPELSPWEGGSWDVFPWIPKSSSVELGSWTCQIPITWGLQLRKAGKFLWSKKVLRQETQILEMGKLHIWEHCPLKLYVNSRDRRGVPTESAKWGIL